MYSNIGPAQSSTFSFDSSTYPGSKPLTPVQVHHYEVESHSWGTVTFHCPARPISDSLGLQHIPSRVMSEKKRPRAGANCGENGVGSAGREILVHHMALNGRPSAVEVVEG